jgi:hypothetical protein
LPLDDHAGDADDVGPGAAVIVDRLDVSVHGSKGCCRGLRLFFDIT